jgi:hypothetical protein
MPTPFFSYVPRFEYISRLPGASISEYITVKNLFRRAKLNPELFNDLTNFTQYKIIGDERPDQVANKIYQNPYYDWIVLLSNNVINLVEEWPLSQESFQKYMTFKYGDDINFFNAHHYETIEQKDFAGKTILPGGLQVPESFTFTFLNSGNQITRRNITKEITNLEYEENIQLNKRNIFLLKPEFLNVAVTNLEDVMKYRKGSTQYVSNNTVRGENIRIYQ